MDDQWIGHRQHNALRHLETRSAGKWFVGCGWELGGAYETAKLMESLISHGFAKRISPAHPKIGDRSYQITIEGRAYNSRNPGRR